MGSEGSKRREEPVINTNPPSPPQRNYCILKAGDVSCHGWKYFPCSRRALWGCRMLGLEEGQWEQRGGMTLYSDDKRLQVSLSITHPYGLFEVCMQSYL